MEENSLKVSFWKKPWTRHAAIVLGIFLLLAIGMVLLRKHAVKTADTMSGPLATELQIKIATDKNLSADQTSQLGLLTELFDFIKSRRDHNRAVFMQMYQYHFTSTTLLLILSSLTTILLLVVAQQGIANAKPYFKTVFFTLAFITTFYAVAPQVYDYEKNIETNLELYQSYEQLRYDVYLYAMVLQEGEASEDMPNFTEFYAGLIKDMRELINIGIKFDSESIQTPDFSNQQSGF